MRLLSRQANRSWSNLSFLHPLTFKALTFLNSIQPVFKIASGDNNFFPLIDTVASFGKPMIVSTGLADLELLARLYNDIRPSVVESRLSILVLHFCTASLAYPVPLEQANLGAIATLKARFPDAVIGYSDHTLGS